MTLGTFFIGLVQTILGAFFGAWLGAKQATKQLEEQNKTDRDHTLEALLSSFECSLDHIEQIEETHFANDEIPTFQLDTVAMAHFALASRNYLPENTIWADYYNGIRFELDHINRKILMFHIRPTEDQLNGIKELIKKIKPKLEEQKDTLDKLVKKSRK